MCKTPHRHVPIAHKQFIASSLKDVTIQQNKWRELTRDFQVRWEWYVPPEMGWGKSSEDQVILSGQKSRELPGGGESSERQEFLACQRWKEIDSLI